MGEKSSSHSLANGLMRFAAAVSTLAIIASRVGFQMPDRNITVAWTFLAIWGISEIAIWRSKNREDSNKR